MGQESLGQAQWAQRPDGVELSSAAGKARDGRGAQSAALG